MDLGKRKLNRIRYSILLIRKIIAPNYRLNQFQFRQALPARLRDYVRGGGTTASGIFYSE